MSSRALPDAWRSHAERNLPRYTSYPTAVAFEPAAGEAEARGWLAATRAGQAISAYVHVPFCKRLCWYCGCHTSVFHEYDRVRAFFQTLMLEVDLWADAIGPHAGAAHLHFGGGSPNALSPDDFSALLRHMADRFRLRPGAEVAAELDPGMLTEAFIDACGEAGVTRVSLGVQTFDPDVQTRVNRIQPFEMVAAANDRLRRSGVGAVNFDLMYGLPGQTPENVAASTEAAVTLRPDRVAVFGYAHVPFCKRLCWYCGCHTSVFHEYDRVRAFFQTLSLEVDLWADAIGPHAGAAGLVGPDLQITNAEGTGERDRRGHGRRERLQVSESSHDRMLLTSNMRWL